MAYRLFGKGSPIVLMHGRSGSFLHWQRDIELLSSVATVYTLDLPGFGDSIEEVKHGCVVLDQAAA
jgi:pimeloyl-ACP methyl ester carboxylesterase